MGISDSVIFCSVILFIIPGNIVHRSVFDSEVGGILEERHGEGEGEGECEAERLEVGEEVTIVKYMPCSA